MDQLEFDPVGGSHRLAPFQKHQEESHHPTGDGKSLYVREMLPGIQIELP